MDTQDALNAASAQWGISGLTAFFNGGQKTVASGSVNGTDVILKIVHLSQATGVVELERCRREVALLRSISSPAVVRVLGDLEVLGSPPEVAMWLEECLDGEDLTASLGNPWNWVDVADLLQGSATGLDAIHRAKSVHRDLSPNNVRRTSSGWVIMDPGLAKHLERSSITGMFDPGTPNYMSPEHLTAGVRLTPAADIFALGILAFQALTGSVPVPFFGDYADYQARLTGAGAPPIGQHRTDLSLEQQRIVDRCLLRQPARRYLNASELLTALSAI